MPVCIMTAYMEVRGIAVLSLNLRARWRLVVNITLRPFYLREGITCFNPQRLFSPHSVFLYF